MRRCLILRRGKPLKPQPPFPCGDDNDPEESVKGSLSRANPRALDRFLRVRNRSSDEGKGGSGSGRVSRAEAAH